MSKLIDRNKERILNNRTYTTYQFCWSDKAVSEQDREQHLDRCATIGAAQTKEVMCRVYYNMLDRCLGKNNLLRRVSYWGVGIAEEWLKDKNNFYEWYTDNFYLIDGEIPTLDKDIKGQNCLNGDYSPETCLLLPEKINKTLYTRCTANYDESTKKYYYVRERKKLCFDDLESLYNEYCDYKQGVFEKLVGSYKSLPQSVRIALKGFRYCPEVIKESDAILKHRRNILKTIPKNISYFELMDIISRAILLPES